MKVSLVLLVQLVIAANLASGQLGQQLSRLPLVVGETVAGTDDGFNIAITGFSNQVGQTLSNTLKNTSEILTGRQANILATGPIGQSVSAVGQLVNGLANDEREMLRRELGVVISVLNLVHDRILATDSISDLNVKSALSFIQDAAKVSLDGTRQIAQPVGSAFNRLMGRIVRVA